MKEKIKNTLQNLRSGIGQAFSALWERFTRFLKSSADFTPPAKEKVVSFVLHWWHWMLGGLFAFIILYYPAGALLTHRIDLNMNFARRQEPNKSQTATVLADLIGREINRYSFTPNLPFIFPAYILDNMPSFQTGVIRAAEKTTAMLAALNPESEDLKQAAEFLSYPENIWYISGWKPSVSATRKYLAARNLLMQYESTPEDGKFNNSPAALSSFVAFLAQGLEKNIALLEHQVAAAEKKMIDLNGDNVFYYVKGEIYVYALILRDLPEDFPEFSGNEPLMFLRSEALRDLKKALMLQPLVVINASPETQFAPNHLVGLGFYLSRASADLAEMYRILD